jgi:hypothetical protein
MRGGMSLSFWTPMGQVRGFRRRQSPPDSVAIAPAQVARRSGGVARRPAGAPRPVPPAAAPESSHAAARTSTHRSGRLQAAAAGRVASWSPALSAPARYYSWPPCSPQVPTTRGANRSQKLPVQWERRSSYEGLPRTRGARPIWEHPSSARNRGGIAAAYQRNSRSSSIFAGSSSRPIPG